jgi:hypothetical protein
MSRLLVMPRRDGTRTSLEASPLRLQGARLLLVTGTAGSGKRIVGNMLVDDRSYVHIDLDNPHANRRFLGQGIEGLRAELEANLEPGQDTVVTWTPPKASQRNGGLPFVRLMQSYGFDWVWLDGDRGAAFHGYFSARNGEAARFVDPFEADGRFRPMTALLDEVLEPGPVAQPLPARRRMPRELVAFGRRHLRRPSVPRLGLARVRPAGSRARAGLAGGLAFGTAAVAASAYVLTGGIGGHNGSLALQSAQAKPATLPRAGVLVSGESLGGVRLGDTTATVRKLWGHRFTVCEGCEPTTWFYWYPSSDAGAGVEFRHGHVTGVYTLGAKVGWRSEDGLKVGGYMSNKEMHEKSIWRSCTGYSAKLETSGNAVTSIFTVGPMVYGFSLTRPSESVCR